MTGNTRGCGVLHTSTDTATHISSLECRRCPSSVPSWGGGAPLHPRGAAVCLQGTGHPGRLQAQPFVTEGLISEELQQKVPNEVAAVVFNPAVL